LKKLLFLFLLFFSISLFATNSLNTFIDKQIKIEAKLLDQNLSLDEKVSIKKAQDNDYLDFFLQYAGNKEVNLRNTNPYRDEVNRLKLRLNSNKYHQNNNAVLRDEILLKNYDLREGIRQAFHETLLETKSESGAFFKDKVNEIVVKFFSEHQALDKTKYDLSDQNKSSVIIDELNDALTEFDYLENVSNTFSTETLEHSNMIYRTAQFSESRLFPLINNINTSVYGKTINTYLLPLHLDAAKVTLMLLVILFILLMQKVTLLIMDRFLRIYNIKESDIEYIHSHITNIFNMITSLIILHLIIVVILGFNITSIDISKFFAILYIILITLLLYRITNTIAYLKIQRMQKSAVLKDEVINLGLKVINTFIVLFAVIAILKVMGVDLTALLSGLGIAGAAVAFAAKDSIANIISSIAILAGNIFEQGDWIETEDIDGTVVEIGLRATTIRTFDNALVSVPNIELANKGVKNWSRRRIGRRIKMNVAVTYESDFSNIKQAIEDIREMLKDNPDIANEHTTFTDAKREARLVSLEDDKGIKRTTLVYMDEYAESGINILIYCFSRTVVWNEWLEVKEDVMYKIADILKNNHLVFAYPTMVIHQGKEQEEI
jgi:MscS family membrane protein